MMKTPVKEIFARISEKDRSWSERAVIGSCLLALVLLPSCVSLKESRRRAEIRYWDGVMDALSGKGLKPK